MFLKTFSSWLFFEKTFQNGSSFTTLCSWANSNKIFIFESKNLTWYCKLQNNTVPASERKGNILSFSRMQNVLIPALKNSSSCWTRTTKRTNLIEFSPREPWIHGKHLAVCRVRWLCVSELKGSSCQLGHWRPPAFEVPTRSSLGILGEELEKVSCSGGEMAIST